MMKRSLILLSLILPLLALGLLSLFPQADRALEIPGAHFYIVTFFTFAALVVTIFAAISLGQASQPRHRLMATAFAAMGTLFFIHGVTTPNALITSFNPGVRWAGWLTLFVGGIIFAVASLDTPTNRLNVRHLHLFQWVLASFCGLFAIVVAFFPNLLASIDAQASPWHQQVVYGLTLYIWLFATLRLWRTWRQTSEEVDGVMALVAAWCAIGTISLHGFPVWNLSWWLYHLLLLLGVVTAVWSLSRHYEQLRQFRLTRYYIALGLMATGGLSLLAAHLISQLVERTLLAQLALDAAQDVAIVAATPEITQLVVNARLAGLLISALSLGLLFALLLLVVNRGDRLIQARAQELEEAYTNLRAAESMRDDLSDMIVHDLRTPLTAIGLSLDLIERSLRDPSKESYRQRFLDQARESVQQMLLLISQLLDVARLEAGHLQLHPEPWSVADLLHEKAASYAPQAEVEQKHIWVESAANTATVVADRALMGRVLDNLIGNALKYTEPGGQVWLKTTADRSMLVVQVADDGPGISQEVAGRIFDKFYQIKGEAGRPLRGGAGLGLAFCRLAVEAHEGRIWVEPRPGQGSIFAFSLPADNPTSSPLTHTHTP